MKKYFLTIAILLMAVSVFAKPIYLGEKITLTKVTKISEIIANKDKYHGKKVLIEGMIIDVCVARGCWMAIASDKPFQHIVSSVDDGVIVFPVHSKGRMAMAEGIFEAYEMDMEETIDYLKHRAEEKGQKFDPSKVKEPMTLYEIFTTGAVIK